MCIRQAQAGDRAPAGPGRRDLCCRSGLTAVHSGFTGRSSCPRASLAVRQSLPESAQVHGHTSIQVHTCPDPSIPCLLLSMSVYVRLQASKPESRRPTRPDTARQHQAELRFASRLRRASDHKGYSSEASRRHSALHTARACSSLCIFHTIPHSSAVLHSPSLHMTQFGPDRNVVIARLGEARDLDPLAEEYAVGRAAEVKHPDKRTISMYDHKPRERASTGSIRSTCL